LQPEVYQNIYFDRIKKKGAYYSVFQLGAYASDLGVIACFFEEPWKRISSAMPQGKHGVLLSQAAFYLRALGRLTECLQPTRAGLKVYVQEENWTAAAITSSNLSDLELVLGNVAQGVADAELSVTYADRSGDQFQQLSKRAAYADSLHQAGRPAESEKSFREAEEIQKEYQPDFPLLYSLQGFDFCELLLARTECAAWKWILRQRGQSDDELLHAESIRTVSDRAKQILRWVEESQVSLLSLGLQPLTLGRVALYKTILFETPMLSGSKKSLEETLDRAVNGLRLAGIQDYLPRGLLTRAWHRFLIGARIGAESAQEDLNSAWEIAERGPMRLHMADIHLYRARLFFREKEYPWESPQADLAAARKLIEQCGYWRRKEELEDAEAVIR